MRPALHASFIRNRVMTKKRRKRTHVFSPRRLLFMVVCGVALFIPGLALTIIGLQSNKSGEQNMDERERLIFQGVGPAMGTLGIVVMFASCIYFNCYGSEPEATTATNSQMQSFDQDQEEKGSIRNKQRDQSQQQQQQQQQQQFQSQKQQLHNGRSIDVYSPECDTIQEEDVLMPKVKSPHRTSQEDIPIARAENICT